MAIKPNFVTKFYNCRILFDHNLIWEDLWVRNGKIQNPRLLFFDVGIKPDFKVDCHGLIISPGYIDLQINGGFEVDFSSNIEEVEDGIDIVAKKLVKYGVTSFCPTIVTSPEYIYEHIVKRIGIKPGHPKTGAGVLGLHLEGPFISIEKRGAHPIEHIKKFAEGFQTVYKTYSENLSNVSIITIAPELEHSTEVIQKLSQSGIVVSLGHSTANLAQAEEAVKNGAKLITHLFNAMLPFHHRDPGIVGLLTSNHIPKGQNIYYGMIADGIHTNPAALRIAHRANPEGLILVTDAVAAMGLTPGEYQLGQQNVTIKDNGAYLTGTNTLAGSIATMDFCVRHFFHATDSSKEQALESATLHPAKCLGITETKGTLGYNSDADFIILDNDLNVQATYICGEQAYLAKDAQFDLVKFN